MEDSRNQELEVNRTAELASISSDDASESVADGFVANEPLALDHPLSIVDSEVFRRQDVEYMTGQERQKCDAFLRMAGVKRLNCEIDALMHGIVNMSEECVKFAVTNWEILVKMWYASRKAIGESVDLPTFTEVKVVYDDLMSKNRFYNEERRSQIDKRVEQETTEWFRRMYNVIIGDLERKGEQAISGLKEEVTERMNDIIDNVMMNIIEEKFGQLRRDVCRSVARDSIFIDTIVPTKMEELKGEVLNSVTTNQEFINRVANSVASVQAEKEWTKA